MREPNVRRVVSELTYGRFRGNEVVKDDESAREVVEDDGRDLRRDLLDVWASSIVVG